MDNNVASDSKSHLASLPTPQFQELIAEPASSGTLLEYVDNFRIDATTKVDSKHRSRFGQFFTPPKIAEHMAAMFSELPEEIELLDSGAGAGMLSAAVVMRVLQQQPQRTKSISVTSFEVESAFKPYLNTTMLMCADFCNAYGVAFNYEIIQEDFVFAAVERLRDDLFSNQSQRFFNLAIINPPYHKISNKSKLRRALESTGLETSNLYSAFMWLTAKLLQDGGQLVAITPRSFCNGPYFRPFRQAFLSEMKFKQIHIYGSREAAFGEDNILQENIITHSIKGKIEGDVLITSSNGPFDEDMMMFTVPHRELIYPEDSDAIIHIATNKHDARVSQFVNEFGCTLADLNLSVSTGRVVDFRAKEILRYPTDPETAPLIYPGHLNNGFVHWPINEFNKPSAIRICNESAKLLIPAGYYVLVKRFSAKEEKRRVTAAVYNPEMIEAKWVGFENHLNYFHNRGASLPVDIAKGLAVYLNSTLVDQYFRQFSGHTQVNANDLRKLRYPSIAKLESMGRRIEQEFPDQAGIDKLISEELGMPADGDPLTAKTKIEEALSILNAIGVPRGQQNERSALTLLALIDLKPDDNWGNASAPLQRITQMMDFFSNHYGVTYAPNTRETVRRQTIHQFWQMGLIIPNPDEPNRPVNSPKYCYQVNPGFLALIQSFGASNWDGNLSEYLKAAAETLQSLQSGERDMVMIPVRLPDGSQVEITAGGQNELIKSIVEEFCPRYTKSGEVIYLGDAGRKLTREEIERFRELNIELDVHGKMPDVVVHMRDKNWLVIIEAVTSHGPIDVKRYNELRELFADSSAGLVFVTAFKSRREMTKYLSDISWETEVWTADTPSHLIHFDGERFLGPYE